MAQHAHVALAAQIAALAAQTTALSVLVGTADDVAGDPTVFGLLAKIDGNNPGGGGGAPYAAPAVHFDGVSFPLTIASLIAADSTMVSVAGWIRIPQSVFDDGGPNMRLWQFGNEHIGRLYWNNPADFSLDLGDGLGTGRLFVITPAQIIQPDIWTWVGAAFDTNFPAGSRVSIAYVGDTPMGLSADEGQDLGDPFVIPFNEVAYSLATGTTILEMADMFMWAGQVIDFSVLANRRKFIDAGGKPVDPAIAIAEFGTPTDFHSGDATGFIPNQGSGGAASIDGSLTNASTSPSD